MFNPCAPTYPSGGQSLAPAITAPDEARGAALRFLSTLAAELSSGDVDLPCFPNIVLQIRSALADPKSTPEKTVLIVGSEPRLAAKLLQTANSAAFNHSGRPLTDLRSAITRLGHQLVQGAAMAFAVQHIKNEQSLRSIAEPLADLWRESIAVASICQVVARRTKLTTDAAFLTGLLHGMGRLYIMVHAVAKASEFAHSQDFVDLISGWHAAIGKAVLENWGFAEDMCEAIGDQGDHERKRKLEGDLTDVLVVGVALAETLAVPAPRTFEMEGIGAFATIGLSAEDCNRIVTHAEYQLGSLQDALGC